MNKTLVILGVMMVLIGLLWPWLQKTGLGRLPGDIVIERENFRFYFPLTSAAILSLLITLLIWLFRR